MFHKYSAVSSCLKAASQLESVLPQGLKASKNSNAVKYTYQPILGSSRGSASAPTASTQPVFYKHWKDIPDSMIPTTSKRDPNNAIYRHPKYIAFRKQQIFYQQKDGIPIYLKGGPLVKIRYYFMWVASIGFALAFIYQWACLELTWFKKK